MHLGRRVWTVPDLTELRSENDSSDDSSQSSAIADEQWHTASGKSYFLTPFSQQALQFCLCFLQN